MKAKLAVVIGFLSILVSGFTYGDCGSCFGGACDENESYCQCTDPGCNNPWDTDCLSRSACCEAFGNVGGR